MAPSTTIGLMGQAFKKRARARRLAPLLTLTIALALTITPSTSALAIMRPTPPLAPTAAALHLKRAAQLATVALSQIPTPAAQAALAERASALSSAALNYRNLAASAELSLYVDTPPPGPPAIFTSDAQIERSQAKSVYSSIATSILTTRAAKADAAATQLNNTLDTMEQLLGALSLSGIGAVATQVSSEEKLVSDEHVANTLSTPPAPPAPAAGMLSVQGPSVLTPQQLADWFSSEYPPSTFRVPIIQMAALYIEQGSHLGVRGDVAFVQASLETGGFSSMSGANNFAGIGDCNSCHGGFDFSTVKAGVAAQVELLKAYSDPSYVTKHSPYGWLRSLSIHGLCPTWFSLGGVWSSDIYYGEHILGLYLNALDLALAAANSPGAKPEGLAHFS